MSSPTDKSNPCLHKISFAQTQLPCSDVTPPFVSTSTSPHTLDCSLASLPLRRFIVCLHPAMTDPADKTPPTDPAAASTDTQETLQRQEENKKDHRPRDSKGWDGKLRLDKTVQLDGPREAGGASDPEASEDEDEDKGKNEGPPPEQLSADEDLLDDWADDEDQIDLVHMRVSSMSALKLERFRKLQRLCLRQNQITEIELPDELAPTLTELDLYDNLISHIRGFDAFTELESLDLSFNKIKHIKRVNHLSKLKDIYFVQNKIATIENLDGLSNLRQVELGANRIRVGGVCC